MSVHRCMIPMYFCRLPVNVLDSTVVDDVRRAMKMSDLRKRDPYRYLEFWQLPLEDRVWPADTGFAPRRSGRVDVDASGASLDTLQSSLAAIENHVGDDGTCGISIPGGERPSIQIWARWDNGEYSAQISAIDSFDASTQPRRRYWELYIPKLGLEEFVELYEVEHGFDIRSSDPEIEIRSNFRVCGPDNTSRDPTQITLVGMRGWHCLFAIIKKAIECGLNTVSRAGISFGVPIRKFGRVVPYLNTVSPVWNYGIYHNYDRDPLRRPQELDPKQTYRCPILLKEHRTLSEPKLQVDVLHTPEGSFLELMTCDSKRYLQRVADKIGTDIEFWEGRPEERWR